MKDVRTGQIIESRARMPLLRHYGVIVQKGNKHYVLHNTPSQDSVMTPLAEFVKKRKVLAIYDSKLTGKKPEAILRTFNRTCKKEYKLFSYNCEHFLECMTGEKTYNTQLSNAAKIAVIVLLWRLLKL